MRSVIADHDVTGLSHLEIDQRAVGVVGAVEIHGASSMVEKEL